MTNDPSVFDDAWRAHGEGADDASLAAHIASDVARAQRPLSREWAEMARDAPLRTAGWASIAALALLWMTPLGALARLFQALG